MKGATKFVIFLLMFNLVIVPVLWYGQPEPESRGVQNFPSGRRALIFAFFMYEAFGVGAIVLTYEFDKKTVSPNESENR